MKIFRLKVPWQTDNLETPVIGLYRLVCSGLNTTRLTHPQNGCHVAEDIFGYIFGNEKFFYYDKSFTEVRYVEPRWMRKKSFLSRTMHFIDCIMTLEIELIRTMENPFH